MSIIEDYKKQKEDILSRSNSLLKALANKRALDISKIKNKGSTGRGGSNEDMQFFAENSIKDEKQEILKNKNEELNSLKNNVWEQAKQNSITKRKKDLATIKNMTSIFSKIF